MENLLAWPLAALVSSVYDAFFSGRDGFPINANGKPLPSVPIYGHPLLNGMKALGWWRQETASSTCGRSVRHTSITVQCLVSDSKSSRPEGA